MIVFCFPPTFHFWVHNCTELLIYSAGLGGGQSEKVSAPVANGLFVFTMGREDGKGDLGRQRGLLLLTANLQQTGH